MRAAPILALSLLLSPGVVAAKGLEPDVAAGRRAQLESNLPDEPRAAIDQLQAQAEELGDPELFLFAARMARNEAAMIRDAQLAERAATLARTAWDIGSYLADERNYSATDWRPITRERAPELAREAASLALDADALARTIHEEHAAAEAARLADAQPEERRRRPGTGLIIGGSAALVLGLGGVGMLAGGIAAGLANQRDADALLDSGMLPARLDELARLDAAGARANAITYAGIGVAAVGIGVGAALIAVGVKRRKAAGSGDSARLRVGAWWLRESAGLTLAGRF